MACDSRAESARTLQRGAAQLAAPKKLSFRRKPVWDKAAPQYEQAAALFQVRDGGDEEAMWGDATLGRV